MIDRRHRDRRPLWQPVNISTTERRDRVGMIRDMSEQGMLFHSRSKFAIGERLTVSFRIDSNAFGSATGEVVRATRDASAETFFPFLTAVHLDAPIALPRVD